MKHLATLNKYFWKYKWLLLLGILFVVLTNYFRIMAPQLTGYVVKTVVNKIEHRTVAPSLQKDNYDILVLQAIRVFDGLSDNKKILFSGLSLLLVALISGFFMFLMRQTIIVMSRHIEYDQKNEVFAHYQQLHTGFYKTHSTGDLMNRIAEDVSRVRMYTGPALMYFINLAAVIGFSTFFMFRTDPTLTWVSLAPLPLLAVAIYFVNNIINRRSEKIQSLLSDLTTNAQESYSGIRVIKSFGQERNMLRFFASNSEAYKTHALGLAKTEAIYFPSMALLIGLSTLLTIMLGAMYAVNDANKLATIVEFVMYIQMLTFPVSAIGWTASMTQRAAASQKRINEFLLTQPDITDSAAAQTPILKGHIALDHVSFTYPHTGIQALKDFTLEVKPGQKVAIVGRTGSGKSTIAQLLLHMYKPQQGRIVYDGVPIAEIQLQHLRNQVGYVPQDVFLFSDTVRNNIAFGLNNATEDAIVRAAGQASVHNEITGFAQGYDTLIGERGVTLSGGQKQRISIARALIKNPQVVIFDDCLSAVDARTENEIVGNLYQFLQDKTALIITHRIFSLFRFDNIVVLHEGKIAEQGTHEQLLALNRLYAEMYARQQSESETDG